MYPSRRTFIKDFAILGSTVPLANSSFKHWIPDSQDSIPDISIFSKHLQFLSIREAAEMAAEMGFSGIDLTVRPNGHLLPENAPEELPRAISEIEAAGSHCQMITTRVESVDQPQDKAIIRAAGNAGVKYYRTNWFNYLEDRTMPRSLEFWQNEIKRLGEFNKNLNITGCYQNHAGTKIGASYWEISELLKTVDPRYFGVQYDIRHAIAESGFSWENGLKLLHQQIKTIVLKDFKWGKVDGKWKAVNVPIGEGMVDFTRYFKLLKAYPIHVPVSLHLEYPLGGAEKGHYDIKVDKKVVFDAMTGDLEKIRKLWQTA